MKGRGWFVIIPLLLVFSLLFTFVQCDHDGMARVTIHVDMPGNSQADNSIIDTILNMFSTRAYAGALAWNSDVSELRLKISAPDMQTIETNIPFPYETFSISIPEGDNRTFRLVSISADQGAGTSINFRGETTINVNPGGNDINILMMPGTEITDATYSDEPPNTVISWNPVAHPQQPSPQWTLNATFVRYTVYGSNDPNGQWEVIYSSADDHPEESSGQYEGAIQYVKISITTIEWGEGVLSEAIPVEIL